MTTLDPSQANFKSVAAAADQTPHHRNVLYSCIAGNALEWYDFVIYGYLATIFGQLFFPNVSPAAQILASWGIFWSGFLARPLGSVVFGHIGDKTSRKTALTWSILMMAIPTVLIGFLPTYQTIGLMAPLLLVAMRTLQGFAMGGEYTGTMVYLVEFAGPGERGIWGSWASFSAVLGVIVGSLLVTFLNVQFTHDQLVAWGWRVPFLISILGSVVGLYIRMKLSDPSVYLSLKRRKKTEKAPLKEVFLHHKVEMLQIFTLDFLTAVGFFMIAIFLATYYKTTLQIPASMALKINTYSMLVFAAATLIGGKLSDRVGRKAILGFASLGFMVFSYPLFQLMQSAMPLSVFAAHSVFAFLFGLFFGVIPSALSEMLPTNVRFSGLSIAHNLCMAIIGGGTPLVCTQLIGAFNEPIAPAYLLIFASTVSFITLFFFPERAKNTLN